MLTLLALLLASASAGERTHSMQYQMHVSRNTRSNGQPVQTGYVYSQRNNDPGELATIEYVPTGYSGAHGSDVLTQRDSVTFNYGGNSEKFSDNAKIFNNDSPMVKFSEIHNEDFKNRLSKFDHHYPRETVLDVPMEKLGDKYKKSIEPLQEKYGSVSTKSVMDVPVSSALTTNGFSLLDSHHLSEPVKFMMDNPSKHEIDYAVAKSEAEYDAKFLPSKMKSDYMYEKLKSIMHYTPPPDSSYMHHTLDFHHSDEDDIRTSSRSAYDSWPFFYHNPYEYEQIKVDADIQKAKDKRYAIDTSEKVIPVHEYTEPLLSNVYRFTTAAPDPSTPDNPITGNQPFFSFVLSDYFQKNEDDPLTFKGLEWGKDYETGSSEPEDFKRTRRLGGSYEYPRPSYGPGEIYDKHNYDNHNYDNNNIRLSHGESATEKGYNNKHEFDNHEKGDDHGNQHESAYEKNGNKYKEFKDFADTFVNKFGAQDAKKDSKYNLKKNQDKGEKKKGFRRVYHKDEYQEDNEFYDNTNHQANAEEKGSTSAHNGGSEAVLASHAAVAAGNDANAFRKAGNTHDKKFNKSHSGHQHKNGKDSEFKNYRDVAQKAAKSNNADYVDVS